MMFQKVIRTAALAIAAVVMCSFSAEQANAQCYGGGGFGRGVSISFGSGFGGFGGGFNPGFYRPAYGYGGFNRGFGGFGGYGGGFGGYGINLYRPVYRTHTHTIRHGNFHRYRY